MGTKERREREKEETRHLILDAARRLFVEQGYEAVSMRKIAEAIEYSPGAVYVHFEDKETLIRELCMEDFSKLDAEAFRLASIPDPVERIRQIGHGYVRFGVANPHHYRLMFMTPHPAEIKVSDEKRAEFEDPSKSGYALLRHAVKEAREQGRLRPELTDDELVAQMLWSGVHGVTSLLITMEHDPCVKFHDPDGLRDLMCEAVIRGILRDAKEGGR